MTTVSNPQSSVRDRILSAIATNADSWGTGPDSVLRLSNIGRCLRQSWYQAMTPTDDSLPKREIDPRVIWEMEDGDIHEPDVIRRFQAAGYTIESIGQDQQVIFVRLPDGFMVPGHPDGVITSGPDIDEPALFEAKSMGAGRYIDVIKNSFGKKPGVRKAEITDWNSKPDWIRGLRIGHPDYWFQVQAYLLSLGFHTGYMAIKAKDSSGTIKALIDPVSRGIIDAKFHVIRFYSDEPTQKLIIERLYTLRQSIQARSPPEGDFSLANGDWQCRFCPYVSICPNGAG